MSDPPGRRCLRLEPHQPLAHRPRANSCGPRHSRKPLPTHQPANDGLSTKRRGSRILVNVHPGSPDVARVSQHQSPTAKPDGQPMENLHLVRYTDDSVPCCTAGVLQLIIRRFRAVEALKSSVRKIGFHSYIADAAIRINWPVASIDESRNVRCPVAIAGTVAVCSRPCAEATFSYNSAGRRLLSPPRRVAFGKRPRSSTTSDRRHPAGLRGTRGRPCHLLKSTTWKYRSCASSAPYAGVQPCGGC